MISVLVLTLNEAQDLPGCLQSVAWCDDVHVYDSGSTDGTLDVARAMGASVWQRAVDERLGLFGGDESAHRNWGLRNIRFRHPWVLQLDADERSTDGLVTAMRAAVADARGRVAFRIQRRDYLNGRWLKHVQATPYYLRLYRPERLCFERLINPVSVPAGPVGDIDGCIDHHPFSKGLTHWFARHNHYSTLEARQIVATREGRAASVRGAFFERDFNVRRVHQKALFHRLPIRPLLKFLLLYVVRGGFLDGRAGLRYAVLQAVYEYMILLKTAELQASEH